MACEQSGCNFPEGECSGECLRERELQAQARRHLSRPVASASWRRPPLQRDYFFADEVAPAPSFGARVAAFFREAFSNGR